MVTCSAWLLEPLPCSCLLASLLGLGGVRTTWDEDTLGDVVDIVVDVVGVVVAGLVAWVKRCQDILGGVVVDAVDVDQDIERLFPLG